jgi:hypothetical protein
MKIYNKQALNSENKNIFLFTLHKC